MGRLGRRRELRWRNVLKITAVFIFCGSNCNLEITLPQSGSKVHKFSFVLPLSRVHLYTFIKSWTLWFFYMRQLLSFQERERNLGHNQMYCAFLHRKEIWGFCIVMGFRDRCWCWVLGFLGFCFGLVSWVFCLSFMHSTRHFALWESWSIRCCVKQMWNSSRDGFLSKPRLCHCAFPVTASHYKDFDSPVVCLWRNYFAQQSKKGHLKVHFEF